MLDDDVGVGGGNESLVRLEASRSPLHAITTDCLPKIHTIRIVLPYIFVFKMYSMIERSVSTDIDKYLKNDDRKIFFLWGPRRSGKTTLLKKLSEELSVPRFNFDYQSDREFFEPTKKALAKLAAEHRVILIDEVQNYPESTIALKLLYDEFQGENNPRRAVANFDKNPKPSIVLRADTPNITAYPYLSKKLATTQPLPPTNNRILKPIYKKTCRFTALILRCMPTHRFRNPRESIYYKTFSMRMY